MAESDKNPTNSKPSTEQINQELMLQLVSLLAELLKMVRDKASAEVGPTAKMATVDKPDLKTALDELEKNTTVRKDGQKREFLLHRALADHEYAASVEGNEFDSQAQTTWRARVEMAEHEADQDSNPMVSCWIPESSIVDVPASGNSEDAQIATQRPQQFKFVVVVRPGKYQVYQEIKQ